MVGRADPDKTSPAPAAEIGHAGAVRPSHAALGHQVTGAIDPDSVDGNSPPRATSAITN